MRGDLTHEGCYRALDDLVTLFTAETEKAYQGGYQYALAHHQALGARILRRYAGRLEKNR